MELRLLHPFPPGLACSVHGSALHMRPSHWGVLPADERSNSRFVLWTTAAMTFWRCQWTRRPHGCITSQRNGPESCTLTFIFRLLRRDNRLPVACSTWQARNTGKPPRAPIRCPQQLSRPISHAHLAHTSRFVLGSPRVSPGGCPPRPTTGTRRGATRSAWATKARCTLPFTSHVPRAARVRVHDRAHAEPAPLCPADCVDGSPEPMLSNIDRLWRVWRRAGDALATMCDDVRRFLREWPGWCAEGGRAHVWQPVFLFAHFILLVRVFAVACCPPLSWPVGRVWPLLDDLGRIRYVLVVA